MSELATLHPPEMTDPEQQEIPTADLVFIGAIAYDVHVQYPEAKIPKGLKVDPGQKKDYDSAVHDPIFKKNMKNALFGGNAPNAMMGNLALKHYGYSIGFVTVTSENDQPVLDYLHKHDIVDMTRSKKKH